mmetsp:Transcript_46467/g.120224  ORF Transcript_46467/g.120224 Transcript_46467/m.120224 type:complete len:386 (-) Transcript_46467:141-1298(-)
MGHDWEDTLACLAVLEGALLSKAEDEDVSVELPADHVFVDINAAPYSVLEGGAEEPVGCSPRKASRPERGSVKAVKAPPGTPSPRSRRHKQPPPHMVINQRFFQEILPQEEFVLGVSLPPPRTPTEALTPYDVLCSALVDDKPTKANELDMIHCMSTGSCSTTASTPKVGLDDRKVSLETPRRDDSKRKPRRAVSMQVEPPLESRGDKPRAPRRHTVHQVLSVPALPPIAAQPEGREPGDGSDSDDASAGRGTRQASKVLSEDKLPPVKPKRQEPLYIRMQKNHQEAEKQHFAARKKSVEPPAPKGALSHRRHASKHVDQDDEKKPVAKRRCSRRMSKQPPLTAASKSPKAQAVRHVVSHEADLGAAGDLDFDDDGAELWPLESV